MQIVKEPWVEAKMSGSEINDESPEKFCFQLTTGEYELLKSQIVILDSAEEFDYSRSQNVTIEHIFQKEALNSSKSDTVFGLHRMKLRSSLLRNIEETVKRVVRDE